MAGIRGLLTRTIIRGCDDNCISRRICCDIEIDAALEADYALCNSSNTIHESLVVIIDCIAGEVGKSLADVVVVGGSPSSNATIILLAGSKGIN